MSTNRAQRFIGQYREYISEKMVSAFIERYNATGGFSEISIPSCIPQREKQEVKLDNAALQEASWAAEEVRKKCDPDNEFDLLGWSVTLDNNKIPVLVNQPILIDCIISHSTWASAHLIGGAQRR